MSSVDFGNSLLAVALIVFCLPGAPASAQEVAPDAVATRPGEVFRDCAECPEFVIIQAGSFQMGSDPDAVDAEDNEEPRHAVTVPAALGVGKYEITVEEFRRFVEASGHSASSVCYADPDGDGEYQDLAKSGYGWNKPGLQGYEQGVRDPVTCVTWQDAQAYVRWLSQRTNHKYRLLTEAEWEYAARGGTATPYIWGSESRKACSFANGADELAGELRWWKSKWPVASCNDQHLYTSPVGSYGANPFGLYDMVGNVSEWVQDCYEDDYEDAPGNGNAVDGDCKYRVVRGGNWSNSPNRLRSAARDWEKPNSTGHNFGFRIVREL